MNLPREIPPELFGDKPKIPIVETPSRDAFIARNRMKSHYRFHTFGEIRDISLTRLYLFTQTVRVDTTAASLGNLSSAYSAVQNYLPFLRAASSFVITIPPSPQVSVFPIWKLNAPRCPIEPIPFPRHCEPWGMRAVFDYHEIMLFGNLHNRVHVRGGNRRYAPG